MVNGKRRKFGPLYLANADFAFNFNVVNFTTPIIEYIGSSAALFNSLGAATTFYEAGISPAFVSRQTGN